MAVYVCACVCVCVCIPQSTTSPLVPVRRPDGDVELQDAGQGFHVPSCDTCGGVLKPHVVFFGE